MFTEGLDESAIKWVKQGLDAEQQLRSPLAERFSFDPLPQSPSLYNAKNQLPQVLPPLKLYAGFLGPPTSVTFDLDNDEESVASVPEDMDCSSSDAFEEERSGSSGTDFSDKPSVQFYDEGLFGPKSRLNSSPLLVGGSYCRNGSSLNRGSSKESLRIQVPGVVRSSTDEHLSSSAYTRRNSAPAAKDHPQEKGTPLGTPSAPPILEIKKEEGFEIDDGGNLWNATSALVENELPGQEMNTSSETVAYSAGQEVLTNCGLQNIKSNHQGPRAIIGEAESKIPPCAESQIPPCQSMLWDQPSYYNTSGQNAWQTLIAYDACIRLCLYAWARGCTEAPEFLRDECLVLRSAFGLHKFLLQPRCAFSNEGRSADIIEETCTWTSKKVVGKIRVEVKKVRIIPRRKLKATYSQRGAAYMQAGVDYFQHVSALLKTGINSLKHTPFSTSEDTLSCVFRLKSSTEEVNEESSPTIYLHPGTGDYHVFFTESPGDALLMEVKDVNRVTQGRATIQLSSLTDNPSDKVRWWPIYHEDNECVGKVQLCIGSTISCDENNPMKSTPVVETLAYDLVLESAMRSQRFHHRNLRLHGPWKWLLTEFSDYYGVSDTYTKLRYLSYVMNVATPTRDCLELVHELLVPVIKAKKERSLSRQEKSILLDCETQVENLLAKVFENYKSLDESSLTGFTDLFGPITESAAPALAPAVQVFTLLHDILSQEAQTVLRNYLQTAVTKRCKRHMLETDEFMSSNIESLLSDPMAISTAYLKMKNLCTTISNEIQADIKIHNQHILPSSIDLSNISATIYSNELCERLRGFLACWPPSSPLPHVTELLMVTADFERDLEMWNIRPVYGGVDSRNLFHNYIMVWIQDKQLNLLDLCKAEKVPWSGVITNHSTSPFAEDMYEKIKDTLNEYEVVINRWPQYSLVLESAVANIERAVIKALEKQYSEILAPLKDSIPKKLGIHVQKLTRRQSTTVYFVPNPLGTFMNTIKRILDVLHCRVEDILKPWASCLPVIENKKVAFGEQMNGITVLLRTKYKNYLQATVEKLVNNVQSNRSTRLKRILEETKEADGEAEVRERMQSLSSQLMDSISNLHEVFSSWIFIAICRGFWDSMGQIVLKFLESRKENRVWYNGSYYALGVLDDIFASQMQRLQGNALQDKDIEPPRSIVEARSILCRDTQNSLDPSTYLYF